MLIYTYDTYIHAYILGQQLTEFVVSPMYVRTYTCTYVRTYTYIHMYVHTHIEQLTEFVVCTRSFALAFLVNSTILIVCVCVCVCVCVLTEC